MYRGGHGFLCTGVGMVFLFTPVITQKDTQNKKRNGIIENDTKKEKPYNRTPVFGKNVTPIGYVRGSGGVAVIVVGVVVVAVLVLAGVVVVVVVVMAVVVVAKVVFVMVLVVLLRCDGGSVGDSRGGGLVGDGHGHVGGGGHGGWTELLSVLLMICLRGRRRGG